MPQNCLHWRDRASPWRPFPGTPTGRNQQETYAASMGTFTETKPLAQRHDGGCNQNRSW